MEKQLFINGEETNYLITDDGKVINKKTRRILKVNENGVVQLTLNKKHYATTVSKLVAQSFIPNPNPDLYKYTTNIDGNKTNNRVNNIKWITASENSNNVWEKRRENNTVKTINKRKKKNIVETTEKFVIQEDEKRIILDEEETPFAITKEGRIRNLRTGNVLKGSILSGYPTVNLRWDGKQKNKAIHRLVAETWLPNPENLPIVDHINGDRLNYNIDNLRWVTASENSLNIHPDKTPKIKDKRPLFSSEELENEKWIYCKKYNYKVSTLGRIIGVKGDFLLGTLREDGYIKYNSYLGHVIVWEAFNGEKPENMDVNHINGNKQDNRLLNLELVSHKENMKKASIETNAWNFRKVAEMNDDNEILRIFKNASEAAKAIGIQPGSMRNTIRRNGHCFNGLKYVYLENE